MKRSARLLSAAALLFAAAGAANASPLRLDYCIRAMGGGMYEYTFTLTLDNNDGTWQPGNGWGWFIFGDVQGHSSPLRDFTMDPSQFPIGPWTSLGGTSGGHNGPSFNPVLDAYWTPSAVGESLSWTGTSATFVEDGQLFFSSINNTGGAATPNFEVAHYGACNETLGACCRADGTCITVSATSCTAEGGVYRGDNTDCATAECPQPATGACCRNSGCSIITEANCLSTGGTYNGDNSTCAQANCPAATAFREPSPDAGDLPSSAPTASGTGSLSLIIGAFQNFSDADMYQINICDPASFSAHITYSPFIGEILLFDASGHGVTMRLPYNGPGTLTNQFVSAPGNYYLAVTPFLKMPLDSSNQPLWETNFDNVERQPDGPGAANPIDHWDSGGGSDGGYQIELTGTCFVGGGQVCYANCDGSTVDPVLNVLDFNCFLNRFSAGASYANCDGSTVDPVLNVLDFNCFLNRFSAGCP
jgi:hypothetical protein